ncbi:30S ribosomal protein S6 [bacterium]|nr:MAG: 30S ribosomal protein S6 [bacterium]
MEEETRKYELATIFDPEIDESDLPNHISGLEDIVVNAGGKMINKEIWGLKDLAYPIKKRVSGYYVFYQFVAPHEAPHKIRDAIRLREDVIRQMTIVRDEFPEPMEGGEDYGSPQE